MAVDWIDGPSECVAFLDLHRVWVRFAVADFHRVGFYFRTLLNIRAIAAAEVAQQRDQ
jgi:hypothetical protein